MTAQEFAARVHARQTGAGKWIARCPAHDDKVPSLGIAEGRDGRTLLHCWAGCEVMRIATALGLTLSDLFACSDPPREPFETRRWRQRPTRKEIRRELRAEALRRMKENAFRGIVGDLLGSEIEAVRRRVGAECGVTFNPLPPSPYEGGYAGRERDPLWSAIFETAWLGVCVEVLGFPLPSLIELSRQRLKPPVSLLIAAEHRAAELMRQMGQQAPRGIAV